VRLARSRPCSLVGWRHAAAAITVVLLGVGLLTGCGSGGTTNAPPAKVAPPAAPLDLSLASTNGTWAVLAMGYLDQPNNTFWEAFYRPSNSKAWSLRTPRGVADNGGLVAAVSGRRVTFGFRPSNDLRFSPLAISSDLGRSYSPALLPDGLVDAPDALSTSAAGQAAALTGTQILTSERPMSTWQPLTSTSSIQTSSAGRQCGVQRITAVVVTSTGVALGADCSRSGIAGVFTTSGSTPRDAGPALPPAAATPGATVDVARLVAYRHGLAALLELTTSTGVTYQGAWQATISGPWTVGPTLSAGPLVSASVTTAGGFSILTGRAPSPLTAAYIEPAAPTWVKLANPPAHTATVSVTSSSIDALAVTTSTFTDYRLTAGQWISAQTLAVRVPIGSSS
jgi:hypothetical protein